MQSKLLLLLLSTLITSLASAGESPAKPTCHLLMTERECNDHLNQLARLPAGTALERYLAEFASTKKEREGLCNAEHSSASIASNKPQRQALLFY